VGSGVASPFRLAGVQRQVKVGAPGDAAEHEAQRTADHVTSGPASSQPTISRLELLQRQVTEKGAQEPAPMETSVQRVEEQPKKEADPAAPVQRAQSEPQSEPKKDETPAPAVQRAGADQMPEDKKETPAVQRCCTCPEEQMQHRPSGTASVQCKSRDESAPDETVSRKAADMDAAAAHAISTRDGGTPMREPVRRTLESRMGVDLRDVRVHEGPAARESAAAMDARAFTHKGDIWLGRGESQDNVHLMAHEATHVVQQGAAVRRAPDAPKQEEESKPVVRRSLWGDITGVVGAGLDKAGRLVDAAGNLVQMGADFFWSLVKKVAPGIVPIIQDIRAKGIVGYLREKISGAFNGIFSRLASGGGFIAGLIKTFTKLFASASGIVSALGRGDCQPLFDAVSELGNVLKEMAGEAWDKIKAFFAPIGDFFSDLWKKFGAPVVDFLGQVASDIWEDIKALGRKIWDWTQPVRDALAAAWKWIKDQLGIGDEPEGQNGLLQWVQGKLGDAWNWIKDKLEPVIGPMKALVEKIKAILPLDAILNLRETVHEWLQHAGDMVHNMRNKKGVTQNQESLRQKILPAIKGAIARVAGKIASAGSWIAGQIGGIAQTVTGFFASLRSNSILGKLSGAIEWVQDKVNSLEEWVQSGVIGLFNAIGKGVNKLADFIEPVLNVLQKIVSVITNVVKELPGLVLGPVWKAIPACIRDPIKDFIVEHILSAIPIISTFLKIPDIWGKIQKLVMGFLSQVFVDGDLGGAAMTVIRFVLEAVGVNVDLFLNILENAAGALDDIIMHPVAFLGNLFGALKQGLGQFVSNIGRHLINGLLGWLLGPLEDLGVTPPKELTVASVLDLGLQILGITADKIKKKLEKAIGPTAVRLITEAWSWISALIKGGLSGLWEQIKERLSDLWGMVIGGITQWITVELVEAGVARLVTMSNPAGAVIEAIRTIYKTLSFLVSKINQILALVNSVVNSISKIAKGAIGDAANWIENAMARTVPTIIAFFADWLGIGNPAPTIRQIVTGIQGKVDAALDWLIDKALAIGKSIMGALGLGEKPDDRTPEQKQADLNSAMSEARSAAKEPDATSETVETKLPAIKSKYRLNVLELRPKDGGNYDIHGELNPVADEIVPLKPGDIPESAEPAYGGVSAALGGTSMKVEPLTKKHKGGSTPSSSPGVWDKVRPDALKRNDKGLYVRGHLLNRRLGGPGTDQNMTPITYSANGRHFQQAESDVVDLVESQKSIVHYEVDVLPPAPAAAPGVIPEEQQLSAGLKWAWWELKVTGGDALHPQLAKTGKGQSGVVENVGAGVSPPYPQT
jgi:hypothetical protein